MEARKKWLHFGQQTVFWREMGEIGRGIRCSWWLMGELMASGVGGGAFEAGGDIATTFIGTGEERVRWRWWWWWWAVEELPPEELPPPPPHPIPLLLLDCE